MEFSRKKNALVIFIVALPFLLYLCVVPLPSSVIDIIGKQIFNQHTQNNTASITNVIDTEPAIILPPKHLENPPEIIKAVFVTGWSAGTQRYRNYLQSLIATTQINAVVIDVKDSSGMVSYASEITKVKEYKAYQRKISDIQNLIQQLHDQGIYVIGRIVVFEDPVLAKARPDLAIYNASKKAEIPLRVVTWKDNHGLAWMDPASTEVWDYNIAIAKEAVDLGFDEINFDYMRFPTDGSLGNMGFNFWDEKTPESLVIQSFLKTARASLPDTKISADIFGQSTTDPGDMGIGQHFEDILPYVDYICPMVYPSHYINGFLGFSNPANHPYEIVKYSLDRAVARKEALAQQDTTGTIALAKIRPWLQDFNVGAIYNADMVLQEIKATQDAVGPDFKGYLLWNPSNIYTKGAITKEVALPQ